MKKTVTLALAFALVLGRCPAAPTLTNRLILPRTALQKKRNPRRIH